MKDFNPDDWEPVDEQPADFNPDDWEPVEEPSDGGAPFGGFSKTDSFTRGLVQGASLGAADEIYGAGKAVYDRVTNNSWQDNLKGAAELLVKPVAGSIYDAFTDEGLQEGYSKNANEQRAKNLAAEETNPASYITGDLVGSTALPAGIGWAAKAGKLGKGGMAAMKSIDDIGAGAAKLSKGAIDKVAKTKAMQSLAKGKAVVDKTVQKGSDWVGKEAQNLPIVGKHLAGAKKSPKLIKAEDDLRDAIKVRDKELELDPTKYRVPEVVAKKAARLDKKVKKAEDALFAVKGAEKKGIAFLPTTGAEAVGSTVGGIGGGLTGGVGGFAGGVATGATAVRNAGRVANAVVKSPKLKKVAEYAGYLGASELANLTLSETQEKFDSQYGDWMKELETKGNDAVISNVYARMNSDPEFNALKKALDSKNNKEQSTDTEGDF